MNFGKQIWKFSKKCKKIYAFSPNFRKNNKRDTPVSHFFPKKGVVLSHRLYIKLRDLDIATLKMLASLELGMENENTAIVVGGVPVPKTSTLKQCGVKDGDLIQARRKIIVFSSHFL